MASRLDIPFNISILELTQDKLVGLRPVTALDIFDGATHNFHPDGLFSTITFGKVGDPNRNLRFSYIDIKVPIFHPIIYKILTDLKELYGGIMSGRDYAVWNNELKDFERSNQVDGRTGFTFFLEHWKNIAFEKTQSDARTQKLQLLEKYKTKALTDKVIVMPAGMRDIEFDGQRFKQDEINTFYHRILAISNTISQAAVKNNPEMINIARYNLQTSFNSLYEFLQSMVQGKKKLIMGKWASRRIFNGTANVITAMDTSSAILDVPGNVGFNNTVVGMYQMMKAVLPVSQYHIRNGFLAKVFLDVNSPAVLVNKKTLKSENVQLKSIDFGQWGTDEGIEKVITKFDNTFLRHKPLEIADHYIGLIYKGPDGTFRLMQDIDELPPGRSKDHVFPLTFAELLYTSLYRVINNFPVFVTRYPITGVGSIYPSFPLVKTTVKAEVRRELGRDWEPIQLKDLDHSPDDSYVAREFPITGESFLDSLVPHVLKIKKMGAD